MQATTSRAITAGSLETILSSDPRATTFKQGIRVAVALLAVAVLGIGLVGLRGQDAAEAARSADVLRWEALASEYAQPSAVEPSSAGINAAAARLQGLAGAFYGASVATDADRVLGAASARMQGQAEAWIRTRPTSAVDAQTQRWIGLAQTYIGQ